MAVTITDTRTLIDEGDSTTDWTGADGLYTADPYPIELTGSIGAIVSNETQDVYHTHASNVDLSAGVLVYVWALPQGIMDTATNGGIGVHMGDGTDRISYHVGGSDQAGFRHDQASVGWQCFVIDSSSLPTSFTARAGTEASLTWTTITQFGITFKTLVKSVGGVENCFVDVIRYGNTGLRIAGGTSGDPGTFSEIAIEDRSSTSGQAYGVIHQIGEGLFGLQGPFTFGDGVGVGASYFADTNTTVAFEDRGIGTDKYYLNVAGNSVGSATFQLGTQVGTTTSGSDGCTLLCPTGVGASFDASDADIDFVYLYGSTMSGFNSGVSFSADATNGPNHEVYDCSFTGCGQIDPAQVLFKNNRISATTDGATGAVLLDSDSTTDWIDLSFTSGSDGHAIYITATGTYTFDTFTYTGYGPTVASFHTTDDVDAGADVVTITSHGYTTEDPIHYMKQGGTVGMGLTDTTTYYVRAVSVNTIAFYTSAVNATNDTSRIALTSTGTETHYINSTNASVYNNSSGAVTINIVGGNIPTIRNGSSATTTVNNSVNLEVNGVAQNTQCYIETDPGGTSLLNNSATTVVSGDEYKSTTTYNYSTDQAVIIKSRELGYLPFESSGTVTDSGLTITAIWQVDPNFKRTVSGESIQFTNATSLITRAGDFGTDGWLSVMSQVTVAGSTDNDGTYTITAVGTTTITISGSLTDGTDTTGVTLTYTRRAATW